MIFNETKELSLSVWYWNLVPVGRAFVPHNDQADKR
jgi:hypothetical protein